MPYQIAKNRYVKRGEHVWHRRKRDYKCVLCGAVTDEPPDVLDKDWMPTRYEPLSQEDRGMCPKP